jgi:hypothetical protein
MFESYEHRSKEEIENILEDNYDNNSNLLDSLSNICVNFHIKMCCILKYFPQLSPTTFKRRVHSILRGDGDGSKVLLLL